MSNPEKIIYISIAVIVGLVVIYFLYLSVIYLAVNRKINRRYDNNPLLKYFTADDFNDLNAESFSFKTKNNKTLRGYIYSSSQVTNFARVIIFFHGIGAGHQAYTKEINRLVKDNNLAVLAYDNLGCGQSDGRNIKDVSWALVDATYFLRYLKQNPRFKNSELIVIGHSWGGLVAGNIISLNPNSNITRVVVLNGLANIVELSTRYTKAKFAAKYFYRFVSWLKLGRFANHSTLKTLKNHHVSALIAHGARDKIIPLSYTKPLFDYAGKVSHIWPLIYPDHKHFVYLSNRAEDELMAMQKNLSVLAKQNDQMALEAYTKTIDYDLIGQQNDELFATIKQFIIRG